MDYIRFVNSRDIREYLYDIGYKLSGEQKLFVVYNSYRTPLDEKIEALKNLLQEEDENVKLRNPHYWRDDDSVFKKEISLHALTAGIIENYETLLFKLKETEPCCFYELSTYEDGDDNYSRKGYFPSFEAAYSYCRNYCLSNDSDEEFYAFKIRKQYYEGSIDQKWGNVEDKYAEACFNCQGQLLNITDNLVLSSDRYDYSTDGLFFYLPVPFKKGDIVITCKETFLRGSTNGFMYDQDQREPYVLQGDFFPDEKLNNGVDSSDINVSCIYLNRFSDSCAVVSEVNVHTYDIEYYRKPLTGRNRILKLIGSIIKKDGVFDWDELMWANSLMRAEALYQDTKQYCSNLNPLLNYYLGDAKEKKKYRDDPFYYYKEADYLHLDESVKIWLDDEREAPEGYVHCHSVNETIKLIKECERNTVYISELNLDHDLGEYAKDGGDAIKLLDFLSQRETFYRVELHTANPVGRANMLRMINRYWPDNKNET